MPASLTMASPAGSVPGTSNRFASYVSRAGSSLTIHDIDNNTPPTLLHQHNTRPRHIPALTSTQSHTWGHTNSVCIHTQFLPDKPALPYSTKLHVWFLFRHTWLLTTNLRSPGSTGSAMAKSEPGQLSVSVTSALMAWTCSVERWDSAARRKRWLRGSRALSMGKMVALKARMLASSWRSRQVWRSESGASRGKGRARPRLRS
ncbi:hypothetical protein M3J09_013573 [Ascochyta lentis]